MPYGEKEQSMSINRAPLYATVNTIHQSSVVAAKSLKPKNATKKAEI